MKWLGAIIMFVVLTVYASVIDMDPKIAGLIAGYFVGMYLVLT